MAFFGILLCVIGFFFLRGMALPQAIPRIESGEFQENAEHFWEKSPARQAAQIVIMTTFLELSDQVCDAKILLYNSVEEKVAIICEISSQNIRSDNVRGLVQIGVLIFGIKDAEPILITIIPARWGYARSLICNFGYKVIQNSRPFNAGGIPLPGIPMNCIN
jgi:hypothetical protein